MTELTGTVVDPDAAWLLEHVPAAMSSVRRTLEEWLAIGERLAVVRDRTPSDAQFGKWCRQYNWFGSASRTKNLSDALAAHRFVSTNSTDAIEGTTSVQELARRQRDAEKQAKRALREQQLAITAGTGASVDLAIGDFRDTLTDITADVVLTDPPYPREYLPLYRDLANWADDVLTPGGLLAVMVGHSYLPELFQLLDGPRPYRWTMAYLVPGGQSAHLWQRHVNTFWKPILIYGAISAETRWLGDVATSDPNDNDKDHHEWGQSVSGMRDLVRRLSDPGQTIADPFMGAGTTGVAATLEGRHFIGCDLDPDHVTTAAQRLGVAA